MTMVPVRSLSGRDGESWTELRGTGESERTRLVNKQNLLMDWVQRAISERCIKMGPQDWLPCRVKTQTFVEKALGGPPWWSSG